MVSGKMEMMFPRPLSITRREGAMRKHHLLGLQVAALAHGLPGLAVSAVQSVERKAITIDPVHIGGEWASPPKPTPKRGKPTKADKKAAKRARRSLHSVPTTGAEPNGKKDVSSVDQEQADKT
jgi:hypothetical protein